MSESRIGVYPGTFDPPTLGHMDIVTRALRVVDRLVVAIAINAGKGPMFEVDERVAMVEDCLRAASIGERVSVVPFSNLLMHFTLEQKAGVIIRGLRAVSDFEYEFQMAGTNARLDPAIETVFLMASDRHQFTSSRLVKEIAELGGDISDFVPPRVAKRITKQIRKG